MSKAMSGARGGAKRRSPGKAIVAEIIREDDGTFFVELKPGWAYADANTEGAQHCFGEDTRAAIARSLRSVKPCACHLCAAQEPRS